MPDPAALYGHPGFPGAAIPGQHLPHGYNSAVWPGPEWGGAQHNGLPPQAYAPAPGMPYAPGQLPQQGGKGAAGAQKGGGPAPAQGQGRGTPKGGAGGKPGAPGKGGGGGRSGGGKPGCGCPVDHSAGGGYSDDDDDDGEETDDEDMQHFADVCYSLVAYPEDANGELRFIEDSFKDLKDPNDAALLMPSVQPGRLLAEMRRCVEENARFLAMLVESDEDAQRFARLPPGHQVQERNSVKVRTVLRQFVRDWAEEGAPERDDQYGCLLRALEQYVPLDKGQDERPRVLTPGSGLARLPFEVARRGYSAQGNEFSYHMLQGSKWVLNETSAPNMHTVYPFVLSLEHRRGSRDHLRGITLPDVCPSEELCPEGRPTAELSMCAGEFVEVYSSQEAEWDAVLTCFFLDTAKNVFLYIRTIAYITRPGGIWANIGPLLFHYAEQPSAISIELSWEEIKPAIEKYFEFKEEDVRQAYYTTNACGMFHTRYRCKYFVAVRNSTPTEGVSHPVF